jgi:glutamate--cysteine ligase
MMDIAKEVVAISQAGLKTRARCGAQGLLQDESHFLNALNDSLDMRKTPADELLDLYHGEWGQNINRIFKDFSY